MNEYTILVEELDKIIEKWQQRLNYQSTKGKDIHDCFLCSTVMYEIGRAKQNANIKIAQLNEENLRSMINNREEKDSEKDSNQFHWEETAE